MIFCFDGLMFYLSYLFSLALISCIYNLKIMNMFQALQRILSVAKLMPGRFPTYSTYETIQQSVNESNKILVMAGAGLSTSSGIPDFRLAYSYHINFVIFTD